MGNDMPPPVIRWWPESDQEEAEPGSASTVQFVWNVYQENGDAKSYTLNISFHLPAPACCSHTTVRPNGGEYAQTRLKKET
jgi:hypothetical protein